MNKIYKYPVLIENEFVVALPKGAQILSVQVQNGAPFFWAAVRADELSLEDRRFSVKGTGHEFSNVDNKRFIGTFQLYEETFVGHLFELI